MEAVTSKQQANQQTKGPMLKVLRNAGSTPFEEGLALCRKEGLVIASNQRLGKALVSQELSQNERMAIHMAMPCWTGTMAAYIEPNRAFKEVTEKIQLLGNNHFVIYTDPKTRKRWYFPVPEEHLEKKNTILMAEVRDYLLDVDDENRVIWPKKVGAVGGFPITNGMFPGDAVFDIPCIGGIRENPRVLLRINARVGPVATDYGRPSSIDTRNIHLDKPMSTSLGIIVESP